MMQTYEQTDAQTNLDKLKQLAPWLETTSPLELIEQHSQTFRAATQLFSEPVRSQIKVIYAFVRVADDFVDVPRTEQSQTSPIYFAFKQTYYDFVNQETPSGIPIIDAFIELTQQYSFDPEWVAAFFNSMEMDLNPSMVMETEADLLNYNYGSAAVIGLMCARIFGVEDPVALEAAGRLGDAFQHINFVRDAFDDINRLDRNYFPTSDYARVGLDTASQLTVLDLEGDQFNQFVGIQLDRFEAWLNQGAQGFGELAKQSPSIAIAVLTASLLYEKAAIRIARAPELIKIGKVSPTKFEKVAALVQAVYYVFYFLFTGSNLRFEFKDGELNLHRDHEA